MKKEMEPDDSETSSTGDLNEDPVTSETSNSESRSP